MILFSTPTISSADYPEKPVTVVFPNKAGSTYYTIILSIMNELADKIPQPVGIQPMPGAGTATGSRFAIEQPADGYTLLFIHEGVLQVSKLGMLGHDALKVLEPLAEVVSTSPTIWARADAPYNNFKELADYAIKNPGKIRTAMQTGAPSHVIMAAFADSIGAADSIRPVHIGGGGAGARQGLLASDVDLIGDNPTGMKGMMKAGQVKPLGTLSEKRDSRIPDTKTLVEQGFASNAASGLHGYLWIRRDAPQESKDFWRRVLDEGLNDPVIAAKLEKAIGLDIYFKTGEELEKSVAIGYAERSRLIDKLGIVKK